MTSVDVRDATSGAGRRVAAVSLDASERSFWIGLVVVVLSLISALATYLILTGLTPIVPSRGVVWSALFFNVALIISMIAIITWQVVGLWRAWRAKSAGARLHIRIVALFSLIAALPALLLAVAATVTFSRSLDSWFTGRVRTLIEDSRGVAQAYVEEHGQVIRNDLLNMARDLDAAAPLVAGDNEQLRRLVIAQAGLRDLPAAYIINEQGKPMIAAVEDERLPYAAPTPAALEEVQGGQVALSISISAFRITAIGKLASYPGWYLYVSRPVSPEVLRHLQRTEQNVAEYHQLRRSRGNLKWAHALMYLMISMTALLAAIWVGLWFAGRFVAPIRRLIAAASEVSTGNLDVVLPEKRGEGDLRRLSATFNKMTRELKTQHDQLVNANEQLFERRRFMEAVLSGVSAGVIGLDSDGRIELASRAACALLGKTEEELVGRPLVEAIPAFAAAYDAQTDQGQKTGRAPDPVTIEVGGDERSFAVRVTHEKAGSGDVGMVVTFDDITELVTAQRTSAWADVARRIAHEIKNPLTPIQLSAERIKRKYGRVITEDRETFDKLTDTIVRQVGDLKSMVDEFASFARLPKPVMADDDLRHALQEPVLLFREGHPKVTYRVDVPGEAIRISYDRRLMTQAITNLVKNATESVESHAQSQDAEAAWTGLVEARLTTEDGRAIIEVIDNGAGFPKHNRMRLLEPYVTTKGHKGTGLGLAMVHKITEQHGGTLLLDDAPLAPGRTSGARVRIILPLLRSGKSLDAAAGSDVPARDTEKEGVRV
ncbi:MAG: PAS domain-containing sensor histidine kinase [Hyphomicrobiaceae bacterium]|nr:PAS domain-containing sensor histidine kinase [Hyphomicrobiaceae bacterium]MCC0008511.1 PAS domain-containing sensor histidine kinase [Hyphomicrobiaceae bacterium]